jgi:hypothetical protein
MARSCAAWHKSVKEIAEKKKPENWKPETVKLWAVVQFVQRQPHPYHSKTRSIGENLLCASQQQSGFLAR